jgi:3-isopropylmalate/(R)-2-methylmalate dehydratase large subunit
MRINFEGQAGQGVTAKDLILHALGTFGIAIGTGHAIEYAGAAIRALPVEGRLTVCNMSIELGGRLGLIAPDDATFAYVKDRAFAPKAAMWDRALTSWRHLHTDADTQFDRELSLDVSKAAPQITWGTTQQDVIGVDQPLPDPHTMADRDQRERAEAMLSYMGLTPGRPIAGTPIDMVFIGSCTNARLSDLEAAADIIRGRHVAPHVRALVVPGSTSVKKAAEDKGLDRIFTEAGFEWRSAGCSMCVSINEDIVPPGARCVATSNRNFENRQGPRARTHLASPAMAAAAALAGAITDVRRLA